MHGISPLKGEDHVPESLATGTLRRHSGNRADHREGSDGALQGDIVLSQRRTSVKLV